MNISLATTEADRTASLRSHFGTVDYVILVLMLLASVIVGVFAGWKKSTTTRDFLTGGRNMNPFAVCLSLLGGVISSLSVQGNATEVYLYGTQLWMNLLGCVWGTVIVMFLILPVLYPLNLVSMCQYLEMRFQSSLLKKLASMAQIFNSFMYLGVCLYAPSLTLSSTIGIPTSVALVIFAAICAIYITLGGVRAVVYTDVVQTIVMFAGVLVVVVIVLMDLGGFSIVWNIASEGGRLQFFNLDPNPMVRHTFWSVQILGMYFVVSVIGISQAQFQRLASVRSLRISQSLCVAFLVGVSILWSLFYFSGLVAYATYADCDPLSTGQIEKADQIMAYLVGDKLSHITGLVGLFVAAVAGALLSSLSSQANAMVVLLWEDFLSGWWWFAKVPQDKATVITMILSTCMAALAICSAFMVAKMGTLFQAAYSISGAVIGPFDGLFVMAITAPWVNAKGAITGFLSAMAFNLWLVLGKFYYGAGRSEKLPLSTEGCLLNDDLSDFTYNVSYAEDSSSYISLPVSSTIIPFDNITETSSEPDYLPVYDISYCYLGSIGIIVVFVVSSIVSLITGVKKPSEVDLRLVNSTCFRFYCWLYGDKSDSAELLQFKPSSSDVSKGNVNGEGIPLPSNELSESTLTDNNVHLVKCANKETVSDTV